MPVAYAYDPTDGVIVVTISDHPPLIELRWHAARMTADPALPAAAPLLMLAHANVTPPPLWELSGMAGITAQLRERFERRIALVTATVGMVTIAHLLAVLAGSANYISAFTCERAARQWLLELAR